MKRLQSPNGQYLAVSSGSRISVWDEGIDEPVCMISSHSPFDHIVWTPNGEVLVASNLVGNIQAWKVPSGLLTMNWSPRFDSIPIKTIVCSPCSTYVAGLAESQSILIWNMSSGELVAQFGNPFSANQLSWSADGLVLFTDIVPICWFDDGVVKVFSLRDQSLCLPGAVSSHIDTGEDLSATLALLSHREGVPGIVRRFAMQLHSQMRFLSGYAAYQSGRLA